MRFVLLPQLLMAMGASCFRRKRFCEFDCCVKGTVDLDRWFRAAGSGSVNRNSLSM